MYFLLVYRQMSPRMQKTTAFLVRKGCNHFPDYWGNYTWKDAHSWLIRMRKHCKNAITGKTG